MSPTPSVSPTPSASPTPTTPAVPAPSTTPSSTAAATPRPLEALRYGDSGPEVLAVQQRLTTLGYWLGPADGNFGALTQQAVFALQKSAGLSRDGIVGPKTRAALTAGTRPRATLSGNGIEIDLERQVLMVVRQGAPTVILNTSTGSGEQYTSKGHTSTAYTPTGTFTVFRQVDGQDDSDLGSLWRPKYFYRGWAVHGSPSIPPYPASHGCARLSNAAIDMIWAEGLMPIGSRVLVH
ncbi:peptidoglycan-binding protein [Phycicoccus duodecadis]|uniref:peptidoglycan-binding protein n=1 Tax=Phycicoccus duodecadis TaxID=173053 RepID=UPI001FECAC95|nr:peptidoglycan-binding protein [Phycicoccus duodecadis]